MKYKIGKYIVDAKSPIAAVKAVKMLNDSVTDAGWYSNVYVRIDDVSEVTLFRIISEAKKVNKNLKTISNGLLDGTTLRLQVYVKDDMNGKYKWMELPLTFDFKFNTLEKAHENKDYGVKKLYSELKQKLKTYTNKTIYEDKTLIADLNPKIKDNDDVDFLSEEEQKAISQYREAISNTSNPQLLSLYQHILEEEIEHHKELNNAKTENSTNDSAISPYKKLAVGTKIYYGLGSKGSSLVERTIKDIITIVNAKNYGYNENDFEYRYFLRGSWMYVVDGFTGLKTPTGKSVLWNNAPIYDKPGTYDSIKDFDKTLDPILRKIDNAYDLNGWDSRGNELWLFDDDPSKLKKFANDVIKAIPQATIAMQPKENAFKNMYKGKYCMLIRDSAITDSAIKDSIYRVGNVEFDIDEDNKTYYIRSFIGFNQRLTEDNIRKYGEDCIKGANEIKKLESKGYKLDD